VLGASWFQPEAHFIAADGEDWVGFSAVGYDEETRSAFTTFTGVEKAYRGRAMAMAMAMALRVLVTRYALTLGVAHLRTSNDSVNTKLG